MAKNDGKVTFELDVDDSQVKSKISKSIDEINRTAAGKKTTINVDADTSAATTQLHKVKAAADAVETADPTVTVDADTGAATTQLHGVKADAEAVEASDPTVTVGADTSAATSGLEDVRARAEDAGTAVDALGNSIERAAGKTSALQTGFAQGVGQWAAGGAVSVGKAAVGAIGDVFSGGMDYETGMAKASTLAPQGADMEAFGRSLLALSTETGQDVGTLAEAAYNMLSAGVSFGGADGASLIDYMRKSARLGIGGFTDADTAGLSVKKTLNAYGMTDDEADRVANVMLKTQNKGITDVGKLSQSMSNVTSIAAAGGVSIEQVGAMLATITAQGVETAEATTQSRSLISELMKSDTQANKNMTEALKGTKYAGMSMSEIMAAGGNIVDILGAMETYATGNGKGILDMFSSVEAGNAALKLLTNGGEIYLDNLDYMLDGTDAVTDAYETMSETNAMTLKKIGAQFEAFKLQLYMALAPALEKLLGILQSDDFQASVAMLADKLSGLLSGDVLSGMVDGLVSAASFLLDLMSGKITIGDVIQSGLESAWNWIAGKFQELGNTIGNWFVDGINQFIQGLNSISIFGQNPFNISLLKRFGEDDKVDSKSVEKVNSAMSDTASQAEQTATSAGAMAEASDAARTAMVGTWASMALVDSAASGLKTSMLSAKAAASGISGAIAGLVSRIRSTSVSAGSGGAGTTRVSKYAVGLDVVPYDEYPALLHKGEMVLNAAEASAYRMGSERIASMSIDYEQLARAMANVSLEMDGQKVGRLVEKSVSTAQSARYNRAMRKG